MNTKWKPVKGYEGYYEVSSLGNIRSVVRQDRRGRLVGGKLLTPQKDKYGYLRVRVCIDSIKATLKMHRVVAEAFIPNPCNKPVVNHKNGAKDDNKIDNLEWCTYEENTRHARELGLIDRPFGKNAYRFKRSVKVLDKDGNHLYTLSGNREMAEKGFDFRLVSAVLKGKRKTHRGCTFEEEN